MTDRSDFSRHISQQFNEELKDLRGRVLAMGGLVEQQLEQAIAALVERDSEIGETVVRNDYRVNAMDVEIDERCTRILALRQPTASDLRLLLTVIKVTTDLERIGDEAKRIGNFAVEMAHEDCPSSHFTQLRHLAGHVREILRNALDTFARLNAEQALEVEREDQEIDREYESLMREAMTYMMEDPRSIPLILRLTWVARALERIGDRSCNIAEYVIYLVRGKDVRHTTLDAMEQAVRAGR